jgi:ribonuclease R
MSIKKKKSNHKRSAAVLQQDLLQFLLSNTKKQFTARQLIGILKIDNNKDSVTHALKALEEIGAVTEWKEGKFGAVVHRLTSSSPPEEVGKDSPIMKKKTKSTHSTTKPKGIRDRSDLKRNVTSRKIIEGTVDMTRSGSAYILNETLSSDVYVSQRSLGGALHGDTVSVLVYPQRMRRGTQEARKPEGEVVKVLKRATEFFIGTLRKSKKYAILMPDNLNMLIDILVPLDQCGDAKDGDKVVVRITDWQEGQDRSPIGKVTQSLGAAGGTDFEMKKILISQGFELSHSEEALAEAAAIPDQISPLEIERRRDFREVLTVTIDPLDAKDFDDALSYRILENGNMEVGVHIADVTHFLKPDTPLDREAYKRSTSVYLVDRALPMLPEKLSNNLCSLVPHQDRLTFSAVFEWDNAGKIVKRWFGKTVIHSDQRLTYEEAQTVLDKQPAERLLALSNFSALETALFALQTKAAEMRNEREKNGALGFETDEIRFRLDEAGNPIDAYVKDRKEAHLLIEDFMLLANKEVAFYIDQLGQSAKEIPFVYRVHDQPDMDRVAELSRFAHEMGYKLKSDTPKQLAFALNQLTKAARTDERLKLLEPLAIRTMAKAVYSTDNIGHYGLAFTHYSHFTSPIRRYSDVLAHRILEANLNGRIERVDKTKLEERCKHISNQERKAADAERESVKYMQTLLMSKHIGEVFEGRISGMIDKGMFVQLAHTHAEGLVDFRYLPDIFTLDESKLRAQSRRGGAVYKVGDKLNVRVIAADPVRRQIEMELATEED